MARIRSVHPELFTDEAFCSLSMTARLLAIGIWTQCDDHGIFEWKPFNLGITIFPKEDIEIESLLADLASNSNNMVRRFEIDGKAYGAVRNFCRYQKPKKKIFKYPHLDWCLPYAAFGGAEEENEAAPSGPPVTPKAATKPRPVPTKSPPVTPGEERRGGESSGEERPPKTIKPVVVVVSGETTTTTDSKIASQRSAIPRPLPAEWVPDDPLCDKVFSDFAMSLVDVNLELPAFHALNLQNGTLSQDWGSTFYLFAKQWKVRQARAAPRLELTKSKSEPVSSALFKPTDEQWDGATKLYASTGRWSAQFGPDPMSAACRCPPDILARHIQNPEAIPVLKAAKRAVAT